MGEKERMLSPVYHAGKGCSVVDYGIVGAEYFDLIGNLAW